MSSFYKELYTKEIVEKLKSNPEIQNPMQVPKLLKISLNIGLGKDVISDSKVISSAVNDLTLISAQKPVVTKAKKSIAGFKLRQYQDVGCKVTLRGERMYEFLFKLVHVALPRVRDFKGLNPKSFDGNGNYSFGITEHIIFPEINYDKVVKMFGMDVSLTTSTKNDNHSLELLKLFNFPFNNSKS